MITGQGEMQVTEQGAKRESNEGRGRFDLLPYESLEALAKWSEDGAKKYGDRNWEKGLSVKDCINRMVRHAVKAANGWVDEDHLAAVMWNASAAITMMARRPDCNDHPWKDPEDMPGFLGKTFHIPEEPNMPDPSFTDGLFVSADDLPNLTLGTIEHVNAVLAKKYPTRAKFIPEGE